MTAKDKSTFDKTPKGFNPGEDKKRKRRVAEGRFPVKGRENQTVSLEIAQRAHEKWQLEGDPVWRKFYELARIAEQGGWTENQLDRLVPGWRLEE